MSTQKGKAPSEANGNRLKWAVACLSAAALCGSPAMAQAQQAPPASPAGPPAAVPSLEPSAGLDFFGGLAHS
ncbi:MAG: hypothetical protein ACREFB_16880, partial [Stellaceae bacterium]